MTTFYTIERDGEEIEIEVEFSMSKGSRGARDEFGVPMEPDEDPACEIESTKRLDNNADVELTPEEVTKVEEKCYEYANALWESCHEYERD